MSLGFHVFDPLPASILSAYREGRSEPLPYARMTFGERREIYALTTRLAERATNYDLAVLDLSCVQSLGETSRFSPLVDFARSKPTAVVVRRAVAARHPELLSHTSFASVIIEGDDDCSISEIRQGDGPVDTSELLEREGFRNGASYRSLYVKSREDWLTELVRSGLRKPEEGKRYHLLGDGTRANYWLDVKRVVGQTDVGFEIAYHIAREITTDFSDSVDGMTLVVGNNTAAVLATHVRLLFGPRVSVAVFDRVGPFPYLAKPRIEGFLPVGTSAVVIEDVLSTGREVDLITLLTLLTGGEVVKVITVYHLEIADPLLVSRWLVHALAKPAKALNYVRLPSVSPMDDYTSTH